MDGFGWKVAFIYISTGLSIAILSGWLIGKLKLEKWVADWVYKSRFEAIAQSETKLTLNDRIDFGYTAIKDIVGKYGFTFSLA